MQVVKLIIQFDEGRQNSELFQFRVFINGQNKQCSMKKEDQAYS